MSGKLAALGATAPGTGAALADSGTQVLLVRHGQTDWNLAQRVQGQLDIPLNHAGRAQAAALGRALATEPLDAIYSSDLMRAYETAAAVAAQPGQPEVRPEAGLRERRFGSFEGLSFAEIEARFPRDNERWRTRDLAYAPGGHGEPLPVFHERALVAVTRLAQRHLGGRILLVSHGGVLDCLYRAAQGLGLQAGRHWPLGNAQINRLLYTGEAFTLLLWGDEAHLLQA